MKPLINHNEQLQFEFLINELPSANSPTPKENNVYILNERRNHQIRMEALDRLRKNKIFNVSRFDKIITL